MGRFSLAGVLGFVAVFAIGLAALVNATSAWAGVTFTLTIGGLFASVLAVLLRGWRRGGWLGFALFGWGYFLLGHSTIGLGSNPWRLSDGAAGWIFSRSNPYPVRSNRPSVSRPGSVPTTPDDPAYFEALNVYFERSTNAVNIGRWLSVLLFAGFGAILGVLLARGRRANDAASPPA